MAQPGSEGHCMCQKLPCTQMCLQQMCQSPAPHAPFSMEIQRLRSESSRQASAYTSLRFSSKSNFLLAENCLPTHCPRILNGSGCHSTRSTLNRGYICEGNRSNWRPSSVWCGGHLDVYQSVGHFLLFPKTQGGSEVLWVVAGTFHVPVGGFSGSLCHDGLGAPRTHLGPLPATFHTGRAGWKSETLEDTLVPLVGIEIRSLLLQDSAFA